MFNVDGAGFGSVLDRHRHAVMMINERISSFTLDEARVIRRKGFLMLR